MKLQATLLATSFALSSLATGAVAQTTVETEIEGSTEKTTIETDSGAKTTIKAPAQTLKREVIEQKPIVIAPDNYAARRAVLSHLIDRELAGGRINADQAADMRKDLAEAADFELDKKEDGTLSKSNMRKINKRLNKVSKSLRDHVAETLEDKATSKRKFN